MMKIDEILSRLQEQQPDVCNPDELTDRIMDSLPDLTLEQPKPARRIRLYIVSAIAAAASVLLLLTLHYSEEPTSVEAVADSRQEVPTSVEAVADSRQGVPTSVEDVADSRQGEPPSIKALAESRQEVPTPKLRPQARKKKSRPRNSLPDTLGTSIWQQRENVETALRILTECEADIERSEQQVRNHIIEATFRATPQPANVILVSDENGDYEVQETKRIINI